MLGRRGHALETVTVRICREAGGRFTTNVIVRDLDLAEPNVADARRLEEVVDGLPVFEGTTIVSEARRAHDNVAALSAARRQKERTLVIEGALVWWCLTLKSAVVDRQRPSRS